MGVYLFPFTSATKLHFFLGVFLHFITGDDIVCDNIAAVHLHKRRFDEKLGRAAAGTADYKNVLVTDVTSKTVDELKELRALGYNGLTFGVETGDNEALAFMDKGFRASDVLEQCKKLEAAGISYNFFYLTGISSAGRGEIGAKASAELFNQASPANH